MSVSGRSASRDVWFPDAATFSIVNSLSERGQLLRPSYLSTNFLGIGLEAPLALSPGPRQNVTNGEA